MFLEKSGWGLSEGWGDPGRESEGGKERSWTGPSIPNPIAKFPSGSDRGFWDGSDGTPDWMSHPPQGKTGNS